jgi:hypothetical protein
MKLLTHGSDSAQRKLNPVFHEDGTLEMMVGWN